MEWQVAPCDAVRSVTVCIAGHTKWKAVFVSETDTVSLLVDVVISRPVCMLMQGLLLGTACRGREVLSRVYAKLLLPDSVFLAQNTPQIIWRPGFAWIQSRGGEEDNREKLSLMLILDLEGIEATVPL